MKTDYTNLREKTPFDFIETDEELLKYIVENEGDSWYDDDDNEFLHEIDTQAGRVALHKEADDIKRIPGDWIRMMGLAQTLENSEFEQALKKEFADEIKKFDAECSVRFPE